MKVHKLTGHVQILSRIVLDISAVIYEIHRRSSVSKYINLENWSNDLRKCFGNTCNVQTDSYVRYKLSVGKFFWRLLHLVRLAGDGLIWENFQWYRQTTSNYRMAVGNETIKYHTLKIRNPFIFITGINSPPVILICRWLCFMGWKATKSFASISMPDVT